MTDTLPPDDVGHAGEYASAPYRAELQPMKRQEFKEVIDHTDKLDGLGGGGRREPGRLLTELSHAEEITLLNINNVRMAEDAQGCASAPAFVLDGGLDFARSTGVAFSRLALRTPSDTRVDNLGYSHHEFESQLQRQLTASGSLHGGIPSLFSMSSSYRHASTIATRQQSILVYFQATQLIPKAEVVFDRDDVSLSPDFTRAIHAAVGRLESDSGAKSIANAALDLLAALKTYGHFVPMSVILGGRITLVSSKNLRDQQEIHTASDAFSLAASAKFSIEGVPIKAGAESDLGRNASDQVRRIAQQFTLTMTLRGGDESLASSQSKTLGEHWIQSLGDYKKWHVVGFGKGSLVPTIDFLDETLRRKCYFVLSEYFRSHLVRARTDEAGHDHDERFGDELAKASGIVGFAIKHGDDVGKLQVSYRNAGAAEILTTPWFGGADSDRTDTVTFRQGEEITGLSAAIDDNGIMKAVSIKTSADLSYPNQAAYYGKAGRAEDGWSFKTIEAPRVRGVYGSYSKLVHSMGLIYLALSADVDSREFLLAMEPYLFPDRDYRV
jgi:hypothetical protein